MSTQILMLAAMAFPILLGFLGHALRDSRLARSDTATGRFLYRAIAAICYLIAAWMLFGITVVFLTPPSSPWVMVVGVTGVMFGSIFGMTTSLLDWQASHKKSPSRLASMGSLWDAELDR